MFFTEVIIFLITVVNNYNNDYFPFFAFCNIVVVILSRILDNKTINSNYDIEACRFADTRIIAKIPNALNVLSNIIFTIVGFYHIFGTGLVSFGIICLIFSIYSIQFHWHPTPDILFFHRLFIVLALNYIFSAYTGIRFLDLILNAVYMLEKIENNYVRVPYVYQIDMIIVYLLSVMGMSTPMVFFLLATFCEYWDRDIYINTNRMVSGHTLNNLLTGLFFLTVF